ncbi:MAG TPA: hypothetical protein VGO98_01345 [Candidatus Saccharimonadales bacterium]|jgi:hypothetical protein|nr:hypothetical protein [Candidatus Saccharimonadales bacterium]
MDIQQQAQQSISDDQELAKVLAGINQQTEEAIDATAEEVVDIPTPPAPAVPDDIALPTPVAPVATAVSSDLESIKKDALSELRPLVDKLDVTPEEKFDTYLLLLRSTDDQSLISPAFAAARTIADEARRAQALLDIIKEIDYLSGAAQPAV